jgi:hypothetical protein
MSFLISISLMPKDVEYFFFKHLLTICTSSFETYLLSSFDHLLIRLFALGCLILDASLCIFDFLIPCWVNIWQRFFSCLIYYLWLMSI